MKISANFSFFFVKIKKKKIIICRSPWAHFAGPCALRLGWEFRRRVNLKSLLVRKIENSEPTLLLHISDYVQLIGWNFQSVCDNFWLAANRLRCLNRNDLSRAPIPSYRATVTVLKYRIVSKWGPLWDHLSWDHSCLEDLDSLTFQPNLEHIR